MLKVKYEMLILQMEEKTNPMRPSVTGIMQQWFNVRHLVGNVRDRLKLSGTCLLILEYKKLRFKFYYNYI